MFHRAVGDAGPYGECAGPYGDVPYIGACRFRRGSEFNLICDIKAILFPTARIILNVVPNDFKMVLIPNDMIIIRSLKHIRTDALMTNTLKSTDGSWNDCIFREFFFVCIILN